MYENYVCLALNGTANKSNNIQVIFSIIIFTLCSFCAHCNNIHYTIELYFKGPFYYYYNDLFHKANHNGVFLSAKIRGYVLFTLRLYVQYELTFYSQYV